MAATSSKQSVACRGQNNSKKGLSYKCALTKCPQDARVRKKNCVSSSDAQSHDEISTAFCEMLMGKSSNLMILAQDWMQEFQTDLYEFFPSRGSFDRPRLDGVNPNQSDQDGGGGAMRFLASLPGALIRGINGTGGGIRCKGKDEQEADHVFPFQNELLERSRPDSQTQFQDQSLKDTLITAIEEFRSSRDTWEERGRLVETGMEAIKGLLSKFERMEQAVRFEKESENSDRACLERQLTDLNEKLALMNGENIQLQKFAKEQEERDRLSIEKYKKEREDLEGQYKKVLSKEQEMVRTYEKSVGHLQVELGNIRFELKTSREDVVRFKAEKDQALSKLSMLERDISSKDTSSGSYDSSRAQPHDLQEANNEVSRALTCYCAELREKLTLLVANQKEFWQRLSTLKLGVKFCRPAHAKCALEAHIASIMFANFENECFSSSGVSVWLDPTKRSSDAFQHFKELKEKERWMIEEKVEHFNSFVNDRLWAIFCFLSGLGANWHDLAWVEDYFNVRRCNSKLMALFKALWSMHKLAQSFDPPASIFRVPKGVAFDPALMQLVSSIDSSEIGAVQQVAFCVSPGFRVRNSVIPSHVYPALA